MTIGERLKARREELWLRVQDVAKRAGLKPTTLYDLERGESRSSTKLHRLCSVLGLSVDWAERGIGPRLKRERQGDAVTQPATMLIHGLAVTREAAELAAEWEKLHDPVRSQIADLVQTLVAQQVRSARAARRKGSDDNARSDN